MATKRDAVVEHTSADFRRPLAPGVVLIGVDPGLTTGIALVDLGGIQLFSNNWLRVIDDAIAGNTHPIVTKVGGIYWTAEEPGARNQDANIALGAWWREMIVLEGDRFDFVRPQRVKSRRARAVELAKTATFTGPGPKTHAIDALATLLA